MTFKHRLRYVLAASAIFTAASVSPASATEVTWVVNLTDPLYDYSSSAYTDIKSIIIGAFDTDPDNLTALITPRLASWVNFYGGYSSGAISLDINNDSQGDFFITAPSVALYSSSQASSMVYSIPSVTATGCYSKWSMTSDNLSYGVTIPWRCLGAPASFRLQGWLSDSYGYDFLDYGQILTPVFSFTPPVTAPIVTVPAATIPPVTIPETTTLPPVTAAPITLPPITAPPITVPPSPPGFIDDWIEFLIVKQPVTLQDLLRTTDCCFERGGARSMVVSPSSKNTCKARGRQLFPLKPGICRVTISSGSGKNKLTESLKFRVKRSV
jgi:hypothetical protein